MKRVYLIIHFARKGDKKSSYYLSRAKEKKLNIHSFPRLQLDHCDHLNSVGVGGGGVRGGEGDFPSPLQCF
jgi:hypothetical protein